MYRFTMYLLVLACLAAPVRARPKSQPVDRDYLSALNVANRFLNAWQNQDQETAILLLTDRLREPSQEDRLQALFSAPTGSRSAYELCRGRKLAAGRYEFPIVLFRVSESSPKWQHPHTATLIIVRSGKDEWLLDKLP